MKRLIRTEIERFVGEYPAVRRTVTAWGVPLVGFASASDPLFQKLKSAVSPTHAMPGDLLEGAATAVAFFVPFTREMVRTNVKGMAASEEWARAYIETNELIHRLSIHLKTLFEARGEKASLIPATHNFDPRKLISDWSHRHVAFITGLGRFGLNNMLITARGCCGRIGSLVTTTAVEADLREGGEACLYRHNGTCRRCVERCVNGALSSDGYDRHRCYEMCLANEPRFISLGRADVCGKCLVGIPCSHTNPVKKAASPFRGLGTGHCRTP